MPRATLQIQHPLSAYIGISDKLGSIKFEEDIYENEPLNSLIKRLSNKYGNDFYNTFLESETGMIKGGFVIMVNNHILKDNQRQNIKLKDGDYILFMTPISGG